jgi:hypothetical protein
MLAIPDFNFGHFSWLTVASGVLGYGTVPGSSPGWCQPLQCSNWRTFAVDGQAWQVFAAL